MNEPPCFRIGGEEHNYLSVEVFARLYPQCHDFWDGNWLDTRIRVSVGAFAGRYSAALRADEFSRFLSGLRLVSLLSGAETPSHVAEFVALEEQLSIVIRGDALGHFVAQCVAVDGSGIGNRLEFELTFDQTDLPAMLNGLETITEAFPVRGNASPSRDTH